MPLEKKLQWLSGLVALCGLVGALFGGAIADSWRGAMMGAACGMMAMMLLIGVAIMRDH